MRCPPTGLRRSPPPFPPPPRLANRVWMFIPPCLREVAGEQVDELLEVGVQRAVRRLLDAEVFVDRHARRRRDATRDGAHVRLSTRRRSRRTARSAPSRGGARSSSRPSACSASQSPSTRIFLARAPRAARQGTTRRCPAAPAGGSRPAPRSRCGADRSRSATAPGSLTIAFSTVRARGKPCDCHGFLPTNIATSACS